MADTTRGFKFFLNGRDFSHLVKEISLSRGYRTIGDMAKSVSREIEDRKFLKSIGISSEVNRG